VAVEESAHSLSTRKARPTQLRSLFNAYVRRVHDVPSVCVNGQVSAYRAYFVHRRHSHLQPVGNIGSAILFRTNEPPASSALGRWIEQIGIRSGGLRSGGHGPVHQGGYG